jgi:hypothetical protein
MTLGPPEPQYLEDSGLTIAKGTQRRDPNPKLPNLANIGTVTQRGNYINVRIGLVAVAAIAIVLSITPLEEKVDETS